MKFHFLSPFIFWVILIESACSTGPKYQVPKTTSPNRYKEGSEWSLAQPRDEKVHGEWWKMFGDTELDALEAQVNVSNQNIAASFAAYQEARAIVREARAQYFPTLSISPGVTTQRGANISSSGSAVSAGNFTQYSIPANATWAPDLWGRIRNTVQANIASAQVSQADLENERLLQQADLAIFYYEIRAQDSLQTLYNSTVSAYAETLKLNRALSKTGINSDEAVAQAETQLELAQAQATQLGIARAQYEHAIALLVGQPASNFTLPIAQLTTPPPQIPVSVPSKLLERRPDIAAAERGVAAANAQIGVAMAAYFPNLSLNGGAGLGATTLSALFSAPTFIWSLGASLSETIFDGGLRGATVDQYKAAYEQTVATYKQTVLTAFQQVEDGLAGLKFLSQQLKQQGTAVTSAQRYLRIATSRYRLGIDPYLDVITAQTTVLSAQQTEITVRMQELTTSVQLIEALGGGWDVSKLAQDKDI
jgi:NodT family efflux transporter outer membrane factor (OMF) lipoprotein